MKKSTLVKCVKLSSEEACSKFVYNQNACLCKKLCERLCSCVIELKGSASKISVRFKFFEIV